MLLLPAALRILLAAEPIDLRRGIDGLMGLVQGAWKEDVYGGALFVFVSRRGDRVKILTWDNGDSKEHLARRKSRGRPVLKAFKKWLTQLQPNHAPKTPPGRAIRYTLKQWKRINQFLVAVRVPLDKPLRGCASTRGSRQKNFLFVGHDEAGEHLATLYTLVATCEANGINPVDHLTDVLARINDHPASKLDELLPHKWRGPPGDVAAAAS